jgi:hypothetical protein
MIECSRRNGHDIPSAVQSPATRRAHDLSVGLPQRGPGTGSADPPAAADQSIPEEAPAGLIRYVHSSVCFEWPPRSGNPTPAPNVADRTQQRHDHKAHRLSSPGPHQRHRSVDRHIRRQPQERPSDDPQCGVLRACGSLPANCQATAAAKATSITESTRSRSTPPTTQPSRRRSRRPPPRRGR